MADKQYYLVVTDLGKTLIDEAYNNSTKVNIIEMALGDSGGSYVKPDSSFTQLVSEFGREDIHDDLGGNDGLIHVISKVTAKNAGQTVREFGLYDDLGNMIAYGAYPESLVPEVDSAEFIQLEIEAMVYLDNASAVTISVNPIYQYASEDEAGIIKLIKESEMTGEDESKADDSKALTLFKMLKRKATDKLAGVTFLSHLTNGTSKEKAASEFAVGKKVSIEDAYKITPKYLPDGTDYNTVTEDGWYVISGSSSGNINAPSPDRVVMRVWTPAGSRFTYQECDSYYANAKYSRCLEGGEPRTDWSYTYTSLNKPKPEDIGAVPKTRKVNGKALNKDITLSASDINSIDILSFVPAPGRDPVDYQNSVGFSYTGNGVPVTGSWLTFGNGAYQVQILADYGDKDDVYIRTINGDTGEVSTWKKLFSTGNLPQIDDVVGLDHIGKAAVGISVSGHDVSDSFMEFYDYGEDDFDMVSFDPSQYETHIYYDGYYLVDVEVVRDDTKPSGANGINTFVMRNNIQIMHGFVDIADTDKRNPVRMRRVIKLYGGDKIKVYSDKDGEWIEGGSILFQYLRPIATSKSNKAGDMSLVTPQATGYYQAVIAPQLSR